MYWIQYVSYVLFEWQTSINNWCSFSIIILATLVTWSQSPLPTQGCTLRGFTVKFPIEMNLLQKEYLLTIVSCTCSTAIINTTWHTLWLRFTQQLWRRKHDSAYEIVIYLCTHVIDSKLTCVWLHLIKKLKKCKILKQQPCEFADMYSACRCSSQNSITGQFHPEMIPEMTRVTIKLFLSQKRWHFN